jgi:hypothetical protein
MREKPDLLMDHIELAFEEFHNDHPEVYYRLVELARQWRRGGHAKLGIATLYEKLRWEWHMAGLEDKDGYKLNNNYKALYARLIMERNPELEGLFQIRERTATQIGAAR